LILGVANSHSIDWTIRLKAAAHVNFFILDGCPFPRLGANRECFLAHAALRLTCNHTGYEPLWREQLGDTWREPTSPFTWPVLNGDDARWAVRAAIDAVVAQAYGLTRAQYAHLLSTFSHKSYPKAPERCLTAFDELTDLGLEAFTRKHDPYWDIPLNERLPQPVIDLPGLEGLAKGQGKGKGDEREAEQESRGFTLAPTTEKPRRRVVPTAPVRPPAPVTGDLFAGRPVDLRGPVEAWDTLRRLLDQRGVLTSADAQAATGQDAATLRPLLKRLVEEGLARVEGVTKGTRYVRMRE
jgi:hypothetical protein